MTRSDLHSPANLIPKDYQCVFTGDNQDDEGNHVPAPLGLEEMFTEELAHRGNWQCHHCGAAIRYYAILVHLPTGDTIVVGETCLVRFNLSSPEFQAMRKAASDARAEKRIRALVAEFLDIHPDLAWLDAKPLPAAYAGNSFLADVARKLRQYGNLSTKQVEAVRKAVARINEPEEKEEEVTTPVLTGKQIITGVVLTTRYVDSQYGGNLKMLVRDDRGFKVWGSVPRSLTQDADGFYSQLAHDTRVKFNATVEASNDDPSFGFFKRPTKAEKV